MKTKEVKKSIFEVKPAYRTALYFSEKITEVKINEKQDFVVPWQMKKVKDSVVLVK